MAALFRGSADLARGRTKSRCGDPCSRRFGQRRRSSPIFCLPAMQRSERPRRQSQRFARVSRPPAYRPVGTIGSEQITGLMANPDGVAISVRDLDRVPLAPSLHPEPSAGESDRSGFRGADGGPAFSSGAGSRVLRRRCDDPAHSGWHRSIDTMSLRRCRAMCVVQESATT